MNQAKLGRPAVLGVTSVTGLRSAQSGQQRHRRSRCETTRAILPRRHCGGLEPGPRPESADCGGDWRRRAGTHFVKILARPRGDPATLRGFATRESVKTLTCRLISPRQSTRIQSRHHRRDGHGFGAKPRRGHTEHLCAESHRH